MALFLAVPVGFREKKNTSINYWNSVKSLYYQIQCSGAASTCEVVSVYAVEEQQAKEDDEAQAADDHPTQQEAVAALTLDDLWDGWTSTGLHWSYNS